MIADAQLDAFDAILKESLEEREIQSWDAERDYVAAAKPCLSRQF
jgi:hypothetical protein